MNSTMYVNNQNRRSSNDTKELVLNGASNEVLMRPYKKTDNYEIVDPFYSCTALWESVPATTVGSPIIDAITYAVTTPSANNTIGKIISDYIWKVRSNNTDDLYASNLTPALHRQIT